MAELELEADTQPSRRHRRTERKKARVRRALAVAAGTAIALSFLLVATDLVRVGSSDTPSLAGTVSSSTAADGVAAAPADTAPASSALKRCRALSVDDPLRLWVGGDSLAGSLGPSLGSITGATGVVQPYFDSRVSSGLSNPGFFDWPDHATTELAQIDPEVVVFIIGTNDWTAVSGDTWKADYAKRVDAMASILGASGRTVYWVGAPILEDEKMNTAAAQVNAVAVDVLKHRSNVQYVDAYKLFSDRDGTFAMNLPDETGKVVTMRAGDGIHLTPDGGDYLARAVFKLLDAQCQITRQKVAGATKPTIQSEGSTQVAPGSDSSSGTSGSGSSGSGSGSGSSGATVQTTPPATTARAPFTAPPTTVSVPSTLPSGVAPSAPPGFQLSR